MSPARVRPETGLYQTEDGGPGIQCRFEDNTSWLRQAQIGSSSLARRIFEIVQLVRDNFAPAVESSGALN